MLIAPIYCHIDQVQLDYSTHKVTKVIPAYRITITEEVEPSPARIYPHTEAPLIYQTDEKYLQENHQILLAHYGVMQLFEEGQVCRQTYVLPCQVEDVRPKIDRFADEDIRQKTRLTAPEDRAFLKRIRAKSIPLEDIKKALRICKYYHRHQTRKSGEDVLPTSTSRSFHTIRLYHRSGHLGSCFAA